MKAWKVYDREGYTPYSVITFAETRGKAVTNALGSDEFPSGDWEFMELKAVRMPQLDKFYRGLIRMDWYDDGDRIALVTDAGYRCDDDSIDPDWCERCAAKEYCEAYEEMQSEQEEAW